jgi:hypothetical protein
MSNSWNINIVNTLNPTPHPNPSIAHISRKCQIVEQYQVNTKWFSVQDSMIHACGMMRDFFYDFWKSSNIPIPKYVDQLLSCTENHVAIVL